MKALLAALAVTLAVAAAVPASARHAAPSLSELEKLWPTAPAPHDPNLNSTHNQA